jgi:hypothetical protein
VEHVEQILAVVQACCILGRLCPGHHESAGKRKSGRIRNGNRWIKLVRSMLPMAATGSPYHELGSDYFDHRKRESIAKRLLGRLKALGYDVTLAASAA